MIPATSGTYIVERKGDSSEGFVKEPVIGWLYTEGKTPEPVTIHGKNLLVGGEGIMSPCGMVSDPATGLTFGSVEEWVEFNPKAISAKNKAETPKKPAADPEGDSEGDSEGVYKIEWTNKSFKTKSFWHYDDGEYEFVFVLEGGETAPKQTKVMKKIKRDELMELKKNVDLLDLDDVKNPDPIEDADIEEDEEPDDFDEDEDEDDDDDGGLI